MIKEVLVVEGKMDVVAINKAVEADCIITEGFNLSPRCLDDIEKAYKKARQIQNALGCVCDAARLSCKGAKELYTISLRIGACCKSVQFFENDKK